MDHIDNGLNIIVPYLLTNETLYDRTDWKTFPIRAGYPSLAENITVDTLNKEYAASGGHALRAFAQAWMWFGVLHLILGENFNEADFIAREECDGGWRVCTRDVKDWKIYLVKSSRYFWWKRKRIVFERPTYFRGSINMREIRQVQAMVRDKCLLWDLFAKDIDLAWSELALSFRLIYELLVFVLQHVIRLEEDRIEFGTSPTHGPALDLLQAHFRKNPSAWCTHQTEFLCSALSYSALVYLTRFVRTAREGSDHSACIRHDSCVAFNIDIGVDFVTAHAEPGCVCKHVEAPAEERTRILEQGGIPVLSHRQDKDGHVNLNFVAASPDLKYAAISHLWADGLGNAFGNSLPQCQLTRLADAVRATDKTFHMKRKRTLLWLDVYCVPAQIPANNNMIDHAALHEQQMQLELKQLAIARMGATYAWANYTLIADRELTGVAVQQNAMPRPHPTGPWSRFRRISGPKLANTVVTAAMAISAWNTRCWTYQEHTLAKRSIIHGVGGPLEVNACATPLVIYRSLQQDFLNLASQQSVMGGGLTHNAARDAQWRHDSSFSKFGRAWNAFCGRTTSQWDDMIAVFAILLDLNATAVLKLHPKDRMRSILGSQTTLPLSLLFTPLARLGNPSATDMPPPRLTDRWVPARLQSVKLHCPPIGDLMGVREDGLYLEVDRLRENAAHVIRLPMANRRLGSHFCSSFRPGANQSRFWLSVDNAQVEMCAKVLLHEPTDVILVLELLDPRLDIDHSTPLRGACLMPSGPLTSEGTQPVIFVCVLEWGLSEVACSSDTNAQGTPICSPVGERLTPGSSILLASNIKSWARLPPPRTVRFESLAVARRTLALLSAVAIAGLAVAFRTRNMFAGIPVTVGALLLSIPIYGRAYVIQLEIMYSLHPGLDTTKSWRHQMLSIFIMSGFEGVALRHWPFHLILCAFILLISIPAFISWATRRVLRLGNKSDSKDVQLEALL